MKAMIIMFAAILAFHAGAQEPAELVNSAAELHECVYGPTPRNVNFEFDARVTFIRNTQSSRLAIAFEDSTGAAVAYGGGDTSIPAVGDLVHIAGHTERIPANQLVAVYHSLRILGKTPAAPPRQVAAADVASGKSDCRPVVITGIVREAISPETNRQWLLLALNCEGEIIYLSLPNSVQQRLEPHELIGATVTATGLCLKFGLGFHNYAGRIVFLSECTDLELYSKPTDDFSVLPDIRLVSGMSPMDIARLGPHRAVGRVLAVWGGNNLLLRTDESKHAQVRLVTTNAPAIGERIEAVGFPESDLFQINLTNARWHRLSPADRTPDRPDTLTNPRTLYATASGNHRIDASYHGKTIRLRGTVVSLPRTDDANERVFVDSDGSMIAIDFSTQPELLKKLTVGSLIDICGPCILEFDTSATAMILPRAKGFFVTVRAPDDLRILAIPSWWTPQRLATAIGTLLLILLGILVWTNSLRRLAERRGQELLKERIEGVKAKLKFDERTRLAVELHDSIAQTLTGISMQIAASNLELAARMVKACHKDLRNCLWDLRSQTLEEQDMTKAVLTTLKPHVNDSRVSVRFNVPRSLLSDSAAHDLLCIVRELVINALRHGEATSVKVAGSLDKSGINCSVTDDGKGFDPHDHPGAAEGHFGLQGIVERIHKLHGSFQIESTPGAGCKARFTIPNDHE